VVCALDASGRRTSPDSEPEPLQRKSFRHPLFDVNTWNLELSGGIYSGNLLENLRYSGTYHRVNAEAISDGANCDSHCG
jgi:hypothetical protein